MKRLVIFMMVGMLSVGVFARGGYGRSHRQGRGNGDCLRNIPVGVITTAQGKELTYMWQEEKLARDVYLEFADKYPTVRVFRNISQSEQRHMDAIKRLLERYELAIPVVSEDRGVFKLPKLQELYNALVARGSSMAGALQVGVDIEVLDIKDLEEKVVGMPEDVKHIFNNLLKASEKHKAAFLRNLDRQ